MLGTSCPISMRKNGPVLKIVCDYNLYNFGISEMCWTGQDHFTSKAVTILCSGGGDYWHGIGIILNKTTDRVDTHERPHGHRQILKELCENNASPSLCANRDQKKSFFSCCRKCLAMCQAAISVGDWNAKIGRS